MDKRIEESKKLRDIGLTLTPLRNGNRPFLPKWNIIDYSEMQWGSYHGLDGVNFGLVLGEKSKFQVCVDIDPRNGGTEWLEANPQIWDQCGIIEERKAHGQERTT